MSDDIQWRRPADDQAARPPEREMPAAPPPYAGPPRGTPPPRDWRPRVLIQPPPPRPLPPQDVPAMDAQEREARTLTYGVGMVAGAVLLVVLLILCGRALL